MEAKDSGMREAMSRTEDETCRSPCACSDLLLDGDSSRLYQRLVKEEESVVGIQGGVGERRGPSSLYVFAIPKPGHTTEEIRATVREEVERLATEGPTPEEMEKLRNTLLNDAVRGRQSTLYRAQRLAEFALYDGDPHLLNAEMERYLAVTPDDIRRAAARYLLTDNHALMEVVPEHFAEQPEGEAAPAQSEPAGVPQQPGSPPPQIPPKPPTEPPPPVGEGKEVVEPVVSRQ